MTTIAIAANLANRAHAAGNQVRKGTGLPYIVHPYRVACLVAEAGGSETQIAAAWAHDVLEDCPAFRDETKASLPPEVYALICELTAQEDPAGKQVRGAAFMAELQAMSPAAKLIKLCDRLDNLRDLPSANKPRWGRKYAAESVEVLAALTDTNPATGEGADRLVAALREQIGVVQAWVARCDTDTGDTTIRTIAGPADKTSSPMDAGNQSETKAEKTRSQQWRDRISHDLAAWNALPEEERMRRIRRPTP